MAARPVTIRPPRPAELGLLVEIERAAGGAFADHGMPEIAAADPGSVAELEPYRAAGAAWVAVDATDTPIAYILTADLDDGIHVDQVSVSPDHRGGRIGAALIDHVADAGPGIRAQRGDPDHLPGHPLERALLRAARLP